MNKIETALQRVSQFPLFSGFSDKELFSLFENAEFQWTKHREILFRAGDDARYFGVVLDGAYKLTKTSPFGEDVIVHFASPGDVIAALVMSQTQAKYPVTIISMGVAQFIRLPKEDYTSKWCTQPQLVSKIQSNLFTRMSALHDNKVFHRAPLNQKIAVLLLQLLERYAKDDEMILPMPLTRKEVADSLGVTVEAVIRIMSEWSHQGFIKTNEQFIEILHPDKIIALSHIES